MCEHVNFKGEVRVTILKEGDSKDSATTGRYGIEDTGSAVRTYN